MKKNLTILIVFILLIASNLTVSLPVKAAFRTIVIPEDYPTIASAIENATDGDTVFVKRGIYNESNLMINKSIWLQGEDQLSTKINLNPPWIEYANPIPFDWNQISHFEDALKITANDVKVSGFTITNNVTSMGGLYIVDGNRIVITNNTIQNNSIYLEGSHQIFTSNTVSGSIECYSSQYNVIAGNIVYGDIWVNNPPEFMVAQHTTNLICGNLVVDGNGIAVGGDGNIVFNNKVINSTYGIGTASYASNCILLRNQIVNNDVGIRATSEGHNNTFYGNQVTDSLYGASVANIWGIGENNVLYDNNFDNNLQDVNTDPVIVGSDRNWTAHHGGSFDNGISGNYWSSYNGTDANSDGFGDLPYVIDSNRRDNHPLMAPFNISSMSIDLPYWASAFSSVVFKELTLETQTSEPQHQLFSPVIVIILIFIAVVLVAAGLLVYSKKHKHPRKFIINEEYRKKVLEIEGSA